MITGYGRMFSQNIGRKFYYILRLTNNKDSLLLNMGVVLYVMEA